MSIDLLHHLLYMLVLLFYWYWFFVLLDLIVHFWLFGIYFYHFLGLYLLLLLYIHPLLYYFVVYIHNFSKYLIHINHPWYVLNYRCVPLIWTVTTSHLSAGWRWRSMIRRWAKSCLRSHSFRRILSGSRSLRSWWSQGKRRKYR